MQTNHYSNLLNQADKLYRHNRQGSYKTKDRYYEAYKRFLRYLAGAYRLVSETNQRRQNRISGPASGIQMAWA